MTIEFHRAAIAFHQAEIDKLTGVPLPPGFDVNRVDTWWPAMLAQFANEERPHPWRDWDSGVLPDQAGNNEREPAIYEGAKPFWQQMEREVPFVYDDHGERFHNLTCVRRGGWADFERNVRRMWVGAPGDAYRADERNADAVARIRV